MRLSPLALGLLAALVPVASSAATSATDLDRVVVQGERPDATRPDIDAARARLDERAGGTGLVDGESYRQGRVGSVSDALRFATGVFIQPRFGADEARLSIRGSGLQRTFHGRGLQVLQDGSPINLADGGFDFQALEPLAARYIEVYRGANALEYGAATLGGAINFVSATGADLPGVRGRVEAGSFGSTRAQGSYGWDGGDADAFISLTSAIQDGYREHARQETYRLFANAGRAFGDGLDGRVYLTHVDTRSELPGNLTLAQFNADPSQAAAGNRTLDQRRDFTLTRLAGQLAWSDAAGGTLTLGGFVADKHLDHPIFQVLVQDNLDAGLDLRWRYEGQLGGMDAVTTIGAGYVRGTTDDVRFVNRGLASPQNPRGAQTNAFDQTATNASVFAEQQLWVSERVALVAGVQALRAEREADDRFITAFDESYALGDTGVSPKLGLRFKVAEGVELFGNVSDAYEPPSFGELAGGPTVTLVDAQEARTLELGLRARRGGAWVDAVAYRAAIDNELLALTDGAGNPLGTRNADDTLHQGLELGAGWGNDDWAVQAHGLVNDFRFDGDAVFGDNDLAGVPRQQWRAEAGRRLFGSTWVRVQGEHVPDGAWVDHRNTVRAPGYSTWGLKFDGALGEGLRWFVEGRNLGDRAWVASTSVVADARGLDGAYYLPGDGRSVFVGLEWRP